MEISLVNRFFEKKDHFIRKLELLTDEEKEEVINWFKFHSSYENDPSIDWKRKDITMDEFKALMAKAENSKSAKKRRIKTNAALLFEDHGQIVKETEKWIYVMPLNWEDAKFMDTSKCGGEGAKWCIGWEKEPRHWDRYTSGDDPDDISSFVIAYNKHYDPTIIDALPKRPYKEIYGGTSTEPVADPYTDEYREFIYNMKALKYMIQILDDPEEQTDVYGAQNPPDHIVWTQDDKPENAIGVHALDFELSDSEIEEIRALFDKKVRQIDEVAILNMDPILVKPTKLGQVVNSLGRNNQNCPYEIIIDGDWYLRQLPDLNRYINLSFSGGTVGNHATLNFNDPHILKVDYSALDFSEISDKQFRVLDEYLWQLNPTLHDVLFNKTGTFDYAYAYTSDESTDLSNRNFTKLKNMRYMFFGAKRSVLSFRGCKFPVLASMTQCFANSAIDWLDLRDVEIPENTNMNLMFNNAKISTISCSDPRIIQAAREFIPNVDITDDSPSSID